ncbi:MAG: hypothetical protein HQK76_06495 [Desulfobacterales bacterium]|nr:hypothetical protein [Desulfobacterales bacterium]
MPGISPISMTNYLPYYYDYLEQDDSSVNVKTFFRGKVNKAESKDGASINNKSNKPFETEKVLKNNSSKAKDNDPNRTEDDLTDNEKAEVARLKRIDAEVKAHERAHMAAGGPYVKGGAQYEYQKGPDGKSYAVAGEVSIDTSPVQDNPKATITKMQAVRRAALAPSSPSSQDRSVAAMASQMEAQARMQMATKKPDESEKGENIDTFA